MKLLISSAVVFLSVVAMARTSSTGPQSNCSNLWVSQSKCKLVTEQSNTPAADEIELCTTPDGMNLGVAVSGQGMKLLKLLPDSISDHSIVGLEQILHFVPNNRKSPIDVIIYADSSKMLKASYACDPK